MRRWFLTLIVAGSVWSPAGVAGASSRENTSPGAHVRSWEVASHAQARHKRWERRSDARESGSAAGARTEVGPSAAGAGVESNVERSRTGDLSAQGLAPLPVSFFVP